MARRPRRYLAVLHSGVINDGGAVLNHMLLTALAEQARVALLTVGEAKDYGDVDVLALPGEGCPTRVDEARAVLNEAVRAGPAEGIGLPSNPHHFDAVVGSGWTSGREADFLRRNFYPSAITANALHMDPRGLGAVLGDTACGDRLAQIHRDVFRKSDLVFAPGPKAARDARTLISEGCSESAPPVHELVPGVTVATPQCGSTWTGATFELLMLGRVEDRNKGTLDVARAVGDLLRWSDRRVRLTLRGVPSPQVASFQAFMNDVVGSAGAVRVLPFTTDRARIDADIDASDALIVASEIEPYGLVAGECAARGKPFLVARGNGNGFAELLSEPGRLAGDIGHRFVVEDAGAVSSYGRTMGSARPYAGPRHRVLARAIARLMDDHDRMAEHARDLRRALADHTPAHMAQAFDEAVRRAAHGERRTTRQVPGGRLVPAPARGSTPTTGPGP
ncbi:glycosyltransferase [Nocardiopsis aegyptia]|uniref:glycosyltransferase n=1 Tax=Nocardiopsis aegyptia TaxID=220378 RepID=UPI00366C97CA